jgi:hypothetical protein
VLCCFFVIWWVVCCKFCCFESELSRMCCVQMYIFFSGARRPDSIRWTPRMTYRHANDTRIDARVTRQCSQKKCVSSLRAASENSRHLSIAAVLFSKVTAASFLLLGKGSFCMSLVVVFVVHVSQYPLLFLSFVIVLICDLFIYSYYTRAAVRQSVRRHTSTTIFFRASQASTCSSHKRGRFLQGVLLVSWVAEWPVARRYYPLNSSQAWISSQGPRKTSVS